MTPQSDSITSSTPISEAQAPPIHFSQLPTPELSDLEEPRWRQTVVEQLQDVSGLDEGWDGFGAGPVRRDVILFVVHILNQIMLPNAPPPQVTPMSHGGLMLEWHENGIDLEIETEKPGRLWVSFEDHVEHIEQEGLVTADLQQLLMPIEKLTKRSVVRS